MTRPALRKASLARRDTELREVGNAIAAAWRTLLAQAVERAMGIE